MKIIKFENAFGISKLSFDKQVCFGDDNAVNYLIYAPNGTFKSSFAKTFYNWSNEQKVLDRINEIDFIGEVEIGGKRVIYPNKIDNVLVYSSDVNEPSDYLGYIKQLIMSGLDRNLIQSQEEKIKNKKNEMLDILNKTDIKFDDYTSIVFPNSSFSTLEMLIKFYTGINSSCKVDGLEKIIDIRKIKQKAYSVLDEKKVKEQLKAYQDIIKSRLNSDFYDELFSETKGQDLLKICTIKNLEVYMMSKIDMQTFLNQYWEYFLVLEKEFSDTEKYLTIDEDNYKSFSVEYAKMMQTICSEIDVISKEFCRFHKEDYKADSIAKYAYVITENRPNVLEQEVFLMKKKHLTFKPWENWQYTINTDKNGVEKVNGTPPKWWTMYNKIKHERTTFSKSLNKPFFKFANQENVLNALSALFILEMYFYKDIVLEINDDYPLYPSERSKIFDIDQWDTTHIPASELMAFVKNS